MTYAHHFLQFTLDYADSFENQLIMIGGNALRFPLRIHTVAGAIRLVEEDDDDHEDNEGEDIEYGRQLIVSLTYSYSYGPFIPMDYSGGVHCFWITADL